TARAAPGPPRARGPARPAPPAAARRMPPASCRCRSAYAAGPTGPPDSGARSRAGKPPPASRAPGTRPPAAHPRRAGSSSRQRLERLEPVGLGGRLVAPPAQDAREAHRHARFVALRQADALEAQLEHLHRIDRAHRAETLARMGAQPAVQLQDLLV